MDTNIKTVAFGVFLSLVVAVFAVASVVMSNRPEGPSEQIPANAPQDQPQVRRAAYSGSTWSLRQAKLDEAAQRISYLEELLVKRTKLLEKKNALLEEKNAQYAELNSELDAYLDAMLEMSKDQLGKSASASKETSQLRTQLADLQKKLNESKSAEAKLESDLSDMKEQLDEAYGELEVTDLVAATPGDQAVQTASSQVITQLGESAVPQLVSLLSNEKAQIKIWAATMLGDIGSAADMAVAALRDLTMDSNEQVAAAAKAALDRVLD